MAGHAAPKAESEVGGPYAYYTLSLLVAVYAISQADRMILSILADDIKADLGIDDGQIGFLFGTAFGVFYAVFGVTIGRLADFLTRKNVLSVGIALWSAMTVLSGFAANFVQFALARACIGIGEAAAQPCAQSILSDRFPKAQRAFVLGICISGLFIGNGISKFVGGYILSYWSSAYPTDPPLGFAAWQVAFFAMGLPGLIIALLVFRLREPTRGQADGIPPPPREPRPFARSIAEMSSAVPPLTLVRAARRGWRSFGLNAFALAAAILSTCALGMLVGDWVQWAALSTGIYCAFSWVQALRRNDRSAFNLIIRSPAFMSNALGFSLFSLVSWSIGFWSPPYAIRLLGADPATVGLVMGITAAACAFLGGIAGGRLGDHLRARHPSGRMIVGIAAAVLTVPSVLVMIHVESLLLFFISYAVYTFVSNMWVGVAAATAQDLVLPHMRGAAAATNILGFTLFGLCIGPYAVGKLSVILGDLRMAMTLCLLVMPLAIVLLWHNFRTFPEAEATRLQRAKA